MSEALDKFKEHCLSLKTDHLEGIEGAEIFDKWLIENGYRIVSDRAATYGVARAAVEDFYREASGEKAC